MGTDTLNINRVIIGLSPEKFCSEAAQVKPNVAEHQNLTTISFKGEKKGSLKVALLAESRI